MKKYILGILVCVCIFISGCSSNKDNKGNLVTNYFNGTGELHSYSQLNRAPVLYDDNCKYIKELNYYCIDGDNAYSICTDASCKHEDSSCIANGENTYFVVNDTLYCSDRQIINCDTKKVVYENKLPKEYLDNKEITYENNIDEVKIIDDKFIVLREGGYYMVLDTSFNEITYFNDISKSIWFSLEENDLYFLNKYYKIERVSLADGNSEYIDLGISYIISACDDENYYFVQDRYKDLYRIDKKTKEKKKIDTEVGDFVVVDKYLYYSKDKEDGTLTQIISDTDGNIINEINALEEFGGDLNMYTISYYDGKIYCDILEREDKTYIIEMSLDGSEIKKYEVRD